MKLPCSVLAFAFFSLMFSLIIQPAGFTLTEDNQNHEIEPENLPVEFPKPWAFSFQLSNIIQTGTLGEYVFNPTSFINSTLESQLDWDVKPVLEINIHGRFQLPFGIFIQGSYGYFIPGRSGNMVDRDWISPNPPLTQINDPTNPTHFSEHDNYLKEGYSGNIQVGLAATQGPLGVDMSLGFKGKYYFFDGKGGYAYYPWGNVTFEDGGKVISYGQVYRIPYLGFTIEGSPTPWLTLGINGKVGAFVQVDAIDYHYLRNRLFFDTPRNGGYFAGGFQSAFHITPNLFLTVQLQGEFVPRFKGDTYIWTIEPREFLFGPFTNGAGASLRLIHLTWGIGYQGNLFP